ncbi:MAG TPA: cupin domain-containing protein [Tepidisphaeraceae bacterium]|nr:cupin domain-containing protein [Tepidisphaeraceae bacterium]
MPMTIRETAPLTPNVTTPERRRAVSAAGVTIAVLLHGRDTGGQQTIIDYQARSGAPGPALHLHRLTHETFHVTEGRFNFVFPGERITAAPGTFVHVPPGVPHAFWNDSGEPARMTITFAPAGMEDYLVELLALANESAATGQDIRPLIAQLGRKYDQQVMGPSPGIKVAGR